MRNYIKKIIIYSLVGVWSFSEAAIETNGYFMAMPNTFWPDLEKSFSTGVSIQQNNPFENPDVFCQEIEGNYRLPAIGEFYANYRYISPFHYGGGVVNPGHWSNYTDNDVTKPRLPNVAGRATGSLFGEWGNLRNWAVGEYANGFNKDYLWASEPGSATTRNQHRLSDLTPHPNGLVQNFAAAICVEDLVRTPFNQNLVQTN